MKNKRHSIFKKILLSLTISLVFLSLVSGIFFLSVYVGNFGHLADKTELATIKNEEATLVFSADSVIIGEYFAQNRTNIRWNEVPDHLKNALIATEDKRFYSHKGFDTRSYFRVFIRSILLGDNSSGGGSTLTQQLVKNLYGRGDYGFLSLPVNKLKEIIIASRIEEVYSKEELLLLYLNSVPFGEDVYGVEAAAHRYFNKHTSELSIQESAVLVALLKANTYFNPRLNPANSLARRNLVLAQMEKEHYLTSKSADSIKKLPLLLDYDNVSLEARAGYFVYQVKKKSMELLESIRIRTGKAYNMEKDGLKIYTTLNMRIQEMALKSVKSQLSVMQHILDKELVNYNVKKRWYDQQKKASSADDRILRDYEIFGWNGTEVKKVSRIDSLWHYYKMLNAAVLIINPKDGSVITWVGGNQFTTLPFDMILSHRQIASAFKPFLYATALEQGITPCDYFANNLNKYPGYEDWEPQNYNRKSTPDSTIAFWYALANSMNLPTVDLYFKVGRENLINTCNRLHFPVITDDAPSIALGTLDLSLYEIVRAYASFADKGEMNDLVMINKITNAAGKTIYSRKSQVPQTAFSEETTETITAVLQQAINRGTGTRIRSKYGIRSDVAGKTGTAQNYSDAWFIAYTPDLVLGTWIGARTRDIHFFSSNGSGSSLALPVIAKILQGIESNPGLRKTYLTPFDLPPDVYSFLQCDPFRQTGVKGFFNRLFKGKVKRQEGSVNDGKKRKRN